MENSRVKTELCGSCFFVGPRIALTCHHVLNNRKMVLTGPYDKVGYWIVGRDGRSEKIPFDTVEEYPEIDTTVIRLRKKGRKYQHLTAIGSRASEGDAVTLLGHSYGLSNHVRPQIVWDRKGTDYFPVKVDLGNTVDDREGYIMARRKETINGLDVRLKSITCLRLDVDTIVGMSGGPVIRQRDGSLCGMMSFGYPIDKDIKTESYAIAIEEIAKRVKLD